MTNVNDSRLRWLGPLYLFLFGNLFFRLSFWLEASPEAITHSVLVGLSAGYLFWNVNRWLTLRVQERYPGLERTRLRLIIWLVMTPVFVNAAVFSRYGLHILLGSRDMFWLGLVDYVTSLGIQLFYHAIYFIVYEGWYVLREWRQANREKEQLSRMQWQTRFVSLKNQVNPHFLFNSLNSLSALIEESPDKAVEFVDELSSMYRYLLRANDEEMVQLETEIRFIESYAHLLQTRHGEGIRVRITVDDRYMPLLIPPLTLQLLVENAVKHNVVQTTQPLLIEIDTVNGEQLRVRNNIQRKSSKTGSNGVGLANIAAKYQMLNKSEIVIQEEDQHFTVLLPLLKPQLAVSGFPSFS
ncbi:sensor histidine kinase [Tellurirhabdus rosea]|uniref:sensor histidine kinase n=1 Tax=Tellurirhabdus rosea TaxID=2674997 RepID=UPI002253CAC8|nr:histidine kinase [Tellurirhabdus rosea]